MIANELLKGTETVLDDGRTVYTALVDMELHNEVWGLYAFLKSREFDDAVASVFRIIGRLEQYPAIDGRYVELRDAFDILDDVLNAIYGGRFELDWEVLGRSDRNGGTLNEHGFAAVVADGVRLIGKRLNMDPETVEMSMPQPYDQEGDDEEETDSIVQEWMDSRNL